MIKPIGTSTAAAVVAEILNTGGRADMIAADLAAPDGARTLAKRVRGIAQLPWPPTPSGGEDKRSLLPPYWSAWKIGNLRSMLFVS